MEDLNVSVQSIGLEQEDIITLAFDDAILMPSLSRLLATFSHHFPTTEVELMIASSTDVVPLISEQRADIGLMFTDLAFNADIEPCFIGNLPFTSVCHPDHMLAHAGEVMAMELVSHRQLMCRGYQKQSIDQFLIIDGKIWWFNSFSAIKEMMIHSNLGWAYLPSHLVKEDIANNRLAQVNLSFDHKAWCPPVDLVTSKLTQKGPALSWLSEHLKVLLD